MAEARRERKVVTVLFADLVGFTSRAEQMDPEDVEAELSRYHTKVRSELERFGGTVEKFIGDAVVALFGAPVAHEDDPERAVRAALAVRDWARGEDGLEVRIAVNTGEALVKLGARPDAGEGMATGDVVNTAARLQAAAPANSILIGEATFRATRQVITYREALPVEAKGKAVPLVVWEPLEARSRVGVDIEQAPRSELVGRARELRLLQEAFERAREEQELQLVTLVGVPGIGKSRIVYELSQIVDTDPELVTWRQGRCLPYGDGVSLWALGEMVKAEAGILESDGPEAVAAKLTRTVSALASAGDAVWIERWLRPLVGLSGEETSHRARDESFSAWRRFLERIAERGPTALVFEDLHWADAALLDFLDEVADQSSGVPLLLVCTARPELLAKRPGWGGGRTNALTLSLPPLSGDETARLVHELLEQSVLSAELQQALLERAGGNPLYAEEFARLLAEGEMPELTVPETVQGIIAARIDALPSQHKRLLHDAAVVGKVFWGGAVASLEGAAPEALERGLRELERREFVRRERRSSVEGETEYAFRHVLVRDVAYGQIPRAERAAKHRRAAEWIETLGRPDDHADMLAHHYSAALEYAEAAGVPGQELRERARLALRNAGDRALGLNAFAAAARAYARALELWPKDDPERPHLLLAYGKALHVAEGGGRDALAEAADALSAKGDSTHAAEAEAWLADLALEGGERPGAVLHLDRASAHLTGAEDSPAKAFVLSTISRHLALAGAEEEASRVSRETLALAERLGLDEIRARALVNIGLVQLFGAGEEAGPTFERAIEVARVAGAARELLRAVNNLDTWCSFYGDTERAAQLSSQVRELAARYGDSASVSQAKLLGGRNLYWRGRWDEAVDVFDRHLGERDIGRRKIWELAFRGKCRLARGDSADAAPDVEGIVELATAAAEPMARYHRGCAARLMLELGRREDAAALADDVLADWRQRPFAPFWWVLDLAIALAALGRNDDLLALARTARWRTRWLEVAELYATAEYARAAEVLALVGSRPDEAYVRMQAGGEHVERALEFYRSVGAVRYIREAEALLAAST